MFFLSIKKKESVSSCSFRVELDIFADHVIDSIFHVNAHSPFHVPFVQNKLD